MECSPSVVQSPCRRPAPCAWSPLDRTPRRVRRCTEASAAARPPARHACAGPGAVALSWRRQACLRRCADWPAMTCLACVPGACRPWSCCLHESLCLAAAGTAVLKSSFMLHAHTHTCCWCKQPGTLRPSYVLLSGWGQAERQTCCLLDSRGCERGAAALFGSASRSSRRKCIGVAARRRGATLVLAVAVVRFKAGVCLCDALSLRLWAGAAISVCDLVPCQVRLRLEE